MNRIIIISTTLILAILAGCGDKISPPSESNTTIAPPSGLSALIITGTTLQLTWVDNSDNENGFYVMKREIVDSTYAPGGSQDTTDTWETLASLPANSVIYYDSSVTMGERYGYRVNAYNAVAESDYSDSITISLSIPEAPSGLQAEVLSDSRVSLSWADNSDNETNFLVCRQDTGDVIIAGITDPNETSFIDTDLTGNTQYAYYIMATNSLGSASSGTVTPTTMITVRLIGSIAGPLSTFPTYLGADGDYIYCAGYWGAYNSMKIVDVSLPDQPSIAGNYPLTFQVDDLCAEGDYVYLAHDSGFVMIDASMPSSLSEVHSFQNGSGTHFIGLSASGTVVLATNSGLPDSLLILELSDSTGFSVAGRYAESGDIEDMFVLEDYVYLLTGGSIKIIDISNINNPVVVGFYNPEYAASGIHICADYAYLPNNSGFTIINVANPLTPISAGTYLQTGGAERLFADSSYVYIYNSLDTLRVVDISVPTVPELVGRYDAPVANLLVAGDYIYVCNNDSLQVLRLEDDENTQ